MTKVCGGCKLEKEEIEFGFNGYVGKKDGKPRRRSHCNFCRAKGARKWYVTHKEQAKASKAIYIEKNRDIVQERRRRYADSHIEENRARAASWYKENPERGKANAKVANHKRRALIVKVGGKFTKADIINMHLIQWMRCYYCSVGIEKEYHIDHMTPILRGGSNWIDNICLTCPFCNMSKHTQTAEEFIEQKGFINGI